MEVDQTIQDGNYVVDAEHEGVENAGRAEFQPAMQTIQLRKAEEDEAE